MDEIGADIHQLNCKITTRSHDKRLYTLVLLILADAFESHGELAYKKFKPLVILPGKPSDKEVKKYDKRVLARWNEKAYMNRYAWDYYTGQICVMFRSMRADDVVVFWDNYKVHDEEAAVRKLKAQHVQKYNLIPGFVCLFLFLFLFFVFCFVCLFVTSFFVLFVLFVCLFGLFVCYFIFCFVCLFCLFVLFVCLVARRIINNRWIRILACLSKINVKAILWQWWKQRLTKYEEDCLLK